jgi:DNA-binding NtrC family response regulator
MTQHILAVDDEPDMLKLLERIFRDKTPYQVTSTSNSLEIPKLLEENQFDLIVTDLKMPGMDGMDVLRLVQEKKRFEKVIIITAFGSLESAIEALANGAFDYITKPFKKEQIIHTVNRAMRFQAMQRDAERMASVFDAEPYEAAQKAFRQEYVRRLSARHDQDPAVMAERSGLPGDLIAALLASAPGDQG